MVVQQVIEQVEVAAEEPEARWCVTAHVGQPDPILSEAKQKAG